MLTQPQDVTGEARSPPTSAFKNTACGLGGGKKLKCPFWLANVLLAMPFLHIPTSKSGSNLVCFVHFDLQMCFSLQRRAIFWQRNFKKWSEPGVFCTFLLENMLLATAACNFSISSLNSYLRTRGFSAGNANHWKNTMKHNISRLS